MVRQLRHRQRGVGRRRHTLRDSQVRHRKGRLMRPLLVCWFASLLKVFNLGSLTSFRRDCLKRRHRRRRSGAVAVACPRIRLWNAATNSCMTKMQPWCCSSVFLRMGRRSPSRPVSVACPRIDRHVCPVRVLDSMRERLCSRLAFFFSRGTAKKKASLIFAQFFSGRNVEQVSVNRP